MLPQGIKTSEFVASVSAGTATVLPIGGRGVRWRVAFDGGTAAATMTLYAQLLRGNQLGLEGQRTGVATPAGVSVVLDANGDGSFMITTSDETIYTVYATSSFSVTVVCAPMSPDDVLVNAGSVTVDAIQYSSNTPDADGNLTLTDGVTTTKIPYTP